MNEQNKSANMAYIGRKSCGCVVAFVRDDPKYPKDTAKDVAQFIRNGYSVERVSDDKLTDFFSNRCTHGKSGLLL